MDAEQVEACLRLLGAVRRLPADDPGRRKIEHAARALVRDGRHARRAAVRAERTREDAALLAATVTGAPTLMVPAIEAAAHDALLPGDLHTARHCYVCKNPYRRVHRFYHQLCPDCAAVNHARRTARAELAGRRAVVTGGRVKIGHELVRMMLRDGAEVVVTTRFPADAARRFANVPGTDRLEIVGLDLLDPRRVLAFAERLAEDGRPVDILVNNAAQTIRRPAAAYAELTAGETGRAVDESGLLPDTAPANSWSARLGEVGPAELLETQLVNVVAPFLLADRLLPLLRASANPRRYVVNVSAVEGRFDVRNKTGGHPHTNMAKAALNMMTRTSAAELAAEGIHMCSVDTGWITDEKPAPDRERHARSGWRMPLDVVDGAARVYDPIVRGEAGEPVHGVLLKDYRAVSW